MNSELKAKTLNFIKNNPLMSYDRFRATSNIKVSDGYYYALRKKIKNETNVNYSVVPSRRTNTLNFIKSHPLMSYDKFTAASGIKISDCYYYMLRGEVFSRGKRSNQKSGTYINIVTLSSKGLPMEAKKTIANILKALNTQGMRLEILEDLQARTIEIRRIMV
jgi:hypothetical protein